MCFQCNGLLASTVHVVMVTSGRRGGVYTRYRYAMLGNSALREGITGQFQPPLEIKGEL